MSDDELPGSKRKRKRTPGGDDVVTTPTAVKLPELIVIPKGTKQAMCGCGVPFYFAKNAKGNVTSVSVASGFISRRTNTFVPVPGTCAPTADRDGLGFDHHIDCDQREQHRKYEKAKGLTGKLERPPERPSDDVLQAQIRAAEELSAQHEVRCTGGKSADECNGYAVIALLVAGKLLATPCSVHADQNVAVVDLVGGWQKRELRTRLLADFLTSEKVAAFVEKQKRVRSWYVGRGVTVDSIVGVEKIR